MEALSLFDFNALVRKGLEQRFPSEYWIQAELSDVRSNATGHCYLEFVQKDVKNQTFVAKARGMIWNNVYRFLKPYFEESTGQLFTSGIKVQVKVAVQFHELYGYSLTVLDIDPTYTVGDMVRKRREILHQLEQDGVLTLNKELKMATLPQRIAVISSETAAGYEDFRHQLLHNPSGFFFAVELFPALMQGNQVEESLLNALEAIQQRLEEFDVVVIIRGGGATSDLSGFDTYLLAAACAQFPLPIITGIGHERDETVLDAVAHVRAKTPTAVAEWFIARFTLLADRIEQLSSQLVDSVYGVLDEERMRLTETVNRLPFVVGKRLSEERLMLMGSERELQRVVSTYLAKEKHRLALMQQKLSDASPERLLERGYSLTLKAGKLVTDATTLQAGDVIHTRLKNGEVVSVVN